MYQDLPEYLSCIAWKAGGYVAGLYRESFTFHQKEMLDRVTEADHGSSVNSVLQSLLVTGFGCECLFCLTDNHAGVFRLNLLSQGVRRFGAAGRDMAYVASGRLDGFWEYLLNPRDKGLGFFSVMRPVAWPRTAMEAGQNAIHNLS